MSPLRFYLVYFITWCALCWHVSADALNERVSAKWKRKFADLQTSVWNGRLDLSEEMKRITILENRLETLQATTCDSTCGMLQKEVTKLTESRALFAKRILAEKQSLEEQVAMLRETVQDAKNGLAFEKQQRLRFQDEMREEKRKRASIIEEQLKSLREIVVNSTRDLARKEVDGVWGTWSAWTVCSVTCGSGRSRRSRACTRPRPENGGQNCVGNSQDEDTCENDACLLDGGWGTWSAWTVCSVTCGSGRRSRSRDCTRPMPENGGQNCVGNARDEGTCEKNDCPLDGGWGTWSSWTVCSVTCGSGRRSRSRACTRPRPENGGHNCVGNARNEGTCEKDACPLDGGWGTWSAWTVCSVTCGSGRRSRNRACTRPRPENGGQNCVGNARNEGTCEKDACPLDGGWGTWSAWTVCSVTCGSGGRSRSRACTRPRPENGGQNCAGNARDEGTCEKGVCGLDGGWGTWSAWTVCSVTCGSGRKSRSRACTSPRPENGGQNCVGNSQDENTCEKDACPLDGGWGTWSSWTVCSVTCGSGRKSRSRACTRPRPENGGQNCVGNARNEGTCEKGACGPFTDCWDLRSRGGFTESGAYSITPAPGYATLKVRCDMLTDGGGWTVLQKRHDGSVNFTQTFTKYENGFGDVSGEHWLGLKWIHLMTTQGVVEMRVDLCRVDDRAGYAVYDRFNVSGPGDTYTLHSGVYRTGSMEDWLRYNDGRVFQVSGSCADQYRGGWWYHGCFDANLNGGRYKGGSSHGIMWSGFGGYSSLPNVRSSELKIRPINTPRDPTHPYTCPP